jgi:NarL family two-component system sensor histidine kinase YdfH
MKSKNALVQKISRFIFPLDLQPNEGDKEVLPFFAMITLAIAWMYTVYIRQIDQVYIKVIFTVLMIVHLGMYWAIFRFIRSNRQLRLYFTFQGLLAFLLILLGGDFGLSIGLYSSLIGNAAGALRKNKDLIYVIFGYISLAVISIIVVAGYQVILEWSFVALPAILFSGFIAYMFRRQMDVREKTQKLLEELQKAHTQLAEYAARVEELTLTTERQRMARELHDTLAQGLTGLVLQLEAISIHIANENNPRAQEILNNAMTQARTTLAEARKAIDNLRSGNASQQAFVEQIRSEVQQFQTMSGVPCEVAISVPNPLHTEVQNHLLKMISEALTNIAKHAQAKQAWLRLTENKSHLVLEIEDDGLGFVPDAESNQNGHYGLLGIRERVAMLQGDFSMDSQPQLGTCLLIQIPLNSQGVFDER